MAMSVRLCVSLSPNACSANSSGRHFRLSPRRIVSMQVNGGSRHAGAINKAGRQVQKTLEVTGHENESAKLSTTEDSKYIYNQLCMVDVLENIGISRHFDGEIKRILDTTYSCWLRRDDEIMQDVKTGAMAFRILRMNGYNVSSNDLSHVAEAFGSHNLHHGYLSDTRSLLELHKASQVSISEEESILNCIGSSSGCLLKEQLSSGVLKKGSLLYQEVEHVLNCHARFYIKCNRTKIHVCQDQLIIRARQNVINRVIAQKTTI